MRVEIITPEKSLFVGETTMIRVPGTKGSFQILNNHAPIVSTLEKGIITIRKPDDQEITFNINSGLVECKKNKIIILVE
ncbi:MAG: ATP synthase F1 subunit epsilon [Bacteroidales bacterium]|nr:ATP synthase F1 subunit epsilon [Bacteroidales bacterium]MDD4216764.1 ATP synthase F1 subunit epsilon [Bacteroidales bacterium]MDY0141558.1 ATP synthase F1 subunit epsilon [Bacteroidales bacterium]